MNDAVRVAPGGPLTTADLAARADFTLGLAAISPSSRTIAGPGGTADVEPRVMQVLLVLADAAGQVVTRETLFNRCWGGVYVGDDSLNRAIGAVRKLAADIAAGSFEIETIPRTGYRLSGASPAPLPRSSADAAAKVQRLSRRELTAGVAGIAALGAGLWWTRKSPNDRRFESLMSQLRERINLVNFDDTTLQTASEAVSLQPDSAKALGYLALVRAIRSLGAPSAAVQDAEEPARRALAIDPDEPNALLAMFELQGSTLDWLARDRTLRRIISIDPTNVLSLTELVALVQAAGLNRESWRWNERALRIEPLSADLLGRRALKLWIAGRTSAADKVIDQVRDLYPSDSWSWYIRFLILAMTGRAGAAGALLDNDPSMVGTAPEIAMWRTAIAALDGRDPAKVAKARESLLESSKLGGNFAAQAVMILSALGQVEAAFEVSNGFLLWRGSIVSSGKSKTKPSEPDSSWRIGVQWLFTPPCAVMRADPRFLALCNGIGLVDYWRARGVRPDYQLAKR